MGQLWKNKLNNQYFAIKQMIIKIWIKIYINEKFFHIQEYFFGNKISKKYSCQTNNDLIVFCAKKDNLHFSLVLEGGLLGINLVITHK